MSGRRAAKAQVVGHLCNDGPHGREEAKLSHRAGRGPGGRVSIGCRHVAGDRFTADDLVAAGVPAGAGPTEGGAGDPGHGGGGAARRRRGIAPPTGVDSGGGRLPEEISALRVFDVIAWMDGKNRRLGEPSDLER